MSNVNTDCAACTGAVHSKLEGTQYKGHCPEVAGRFREGDGMCK